jgi:hypothetical protein
MKLQRSSTNSSRPAASPAELPSLRFSKSSGSTAPVEAEWDVQLDCHQTIQAGVELRNIHGTVRLVGASTVRVL